MDDSSRVVFVHPNLAADLIGRVQAGEPIEGELIDGEIGVIDAGFTFVESPALMAKVTTYLGDGLTRTSYKPVYTGSQRRVAQWKAERGLAGRRGR